MFTVHSCLVLAADLLPGGVHRDGSLIGRVGRHDHIPDVLRQEPPQQSMPLRERVLYSTMYELYHNAVHLAASTLRCGVFLSTVLAIALALS